ncbi:MAG: hypothetical protein JW795_20750, partial [Chitinivibrionales bacterium]|nr:hypothetical protein [Chitinivibrionales bacterium]
NQQVADQSMAVRCAPILWLRQAIQPIYSTANGFVANGPVPPTGFEALAATQPPRFTAIPLVVKNLKLP